MDPMGTYMGHNLSLHFSGFLGPAYYEVLLGHVVFCFFFGPGVTSHMANACGDICNMISIAGSGRTNKTHVKQNIGNMLPC